MIADDMAVKIRGSFIEIQDVLVNWRWLVSVSKGSRWNGTAYVAAVTIYCGSGKYYKEFSWDFGVLKTKISGDKCAEDSQADLHKRESEKFFEKICAAVELLRDMKECDQ